MGEYRADVCRRYGVSQPTFYKWKVKFGGLEASDAWKLKSLEAENTRLNERYISTDPIRNFWVTADGYITLVAYNSFHLTKQKFETLCLELRVEYLASNSKYYLDFWEKIFRSGILLKLAWCYLVITIPIKSIPLTRTPFLIMRNLWRMLKKFRKNFNQLLLNQK